MSPFLRHIQACNNAILPGRRVPFHLGATPVGYLAPGLADVLAEFPDIGRTAAGVTLNNPAALPGIAHAASALGFGRDRKEAFDVKAQPGGPSLATIDRGAIPVFGIMAEGVHVNGMVRRADGRHIWVAKRAADKAVDPGKLDHIVAGGMPAGMTPFETWIKEAAEEAAIPESLARSARTTGSLAYAMEGTEGLRRETLYCYDIDLPEDFIPTPADGEVESFALWPLARVVEAVRDGDLFKFDVNLVLIDLFIREHLIPVAEAGDIIAALARAKEASKRFFL